jgi:hypothetical protein
VVQAVQVYLAGVAVLDRQHQVVQTMQLVVQVDEV